MICEIARGTLVNPEALRRKDSSKPLESQLHSIRIECVARL